MAGAGFRSQVIFNKDHFVDSNWELEVCELKLAMRSFRTSVRLEDDAQAVVVNKLEIN